MMECFNLSDILIGFEKDEIETCGCGGGITSRETCVQTY